ncbi:hypothetical protein KIMC2_01870 [Xylocopilactobacillus apis]|uniref:Uncharacterized protein n=1 Tax=Xylocopilactobacillus apis TaxID=2932183 RepID=A0AAU9D030_9LACO|nr:hypothetical protein KIMC2_01870 [Xylocopilactobacillus apis]
MSKKLIKIILKILLLLFLFYEAEPQMSSNLIYGNDFRFSMVKPAKYYYWKCLDKNCGYHSKKHESYNEVARYAVEHSNKYRHPIEVFKK